MQEQLTFDNHWMLLVEEAMISPVAPQTRLVIDGTRAADGSYHHPRAGLTIDAEGAE